MNVFLPRTNNNNSNNGRGDESVLLCAKIVDYASTGIGLGMCDVSMHIHHAVLPEHLEDGGEEELVRHYWTTVTDALAAAAVSSQ